MFESGDTVRRRIALERAAPLLHGSPAEVQRYAGSSPDFRNSAIGQLGSVISHSRERQMSAPIEVVDTRQKNPRPLHVIRQETRGGAMHFRSRQATL